MRGGRNSRFTIYDVMEAKGVFDENVANATSPRYTGPVEYPKMFYHPKGQTRITQKAEILNTPFGPVKVGEQSELINRIVQDAEEEKRIRAAGWHDHPAKAMAASGAEAPPTTASLSASQIENLERQLAVLQAQLNAAKASPKVVDEFDTELAEALMRER